MSEHLQEEENIGKAYDVRLMRRLWQYVAPYRLQVLGTLALVAPIFVMEIAPAWIIKTALDLATDVTPTGASAELSALFEPRAGIHPFAW